MPFTLTMPKLSPTMAEGTIAKWHKKVGDFVEVNDLILEVATDKATVEYNALDAGYLRKILAQEGQKIQVNQPLAVFTENQTESIDGYIPEAVVSKNDKAAPKVEQKAPARPSLAPKPVEAAKPAPAPSRPTQPAASARVFASPLAKTLAKDKGMDLSQVKGTGPQGRIMSRDLAEATQAPVQTKAPKFEMNEQTHPIAPITGYEEVALTPMRKVIAERLQFSKSTIPHFYIRQEIEVSPLVEMRENVKKFEVNLTINDFIIKAVATALRKHPEVNCSFNEATESIIRFHAVDISVAVTIPGGLITPIIFQADQKPLAMISQEIKALAVKAREGKLAPEEYQGGSFTISNLGMFGVPDFQAIINPPQAAILAVGTIQDKPVVKNGQVVPGKILSLTLSCDHRAVDGMEAAQFMQTLKQLLENPILFLSQ